jgi:hypothetical protein
MEAAMAMSRGWLGGCSLLVVLAFVVGGAVAQNKDGSGGGQEDRGAAKKAQTYTGKITRIDVEKRVVELSDLMDRGGAKGAGKGTGTGGSGTGGSGTGAGGKGDSGARTGGGPGRGGRAVTFTVADKATVTLDGKAAGLKDLKVNQYARVHAERLATTTGGKGKAGGAGPVLITSKIEATTKAPKAAAGERGR